MLKYYDPQVNELIKQEEARQASTIRLIPSENYVSQNVMQATGSCLTNKYAEGYPNKRYYEGQQVTDLIEDLAKQRAGDVFRAQHVNVQSYSGSIANMAAYLALADPGDTIMGLSLPDGGHLTHGWKVSATGKVFKSVQYPVNYDTDLFDYDQIAEIAKENKPKILIAGTSAYPRKIDFKAFREIADQVDAYLVCDIAHIAGLVAGGAHESPMEAADVVTTTTHKSLRGPRGALIMCKEEFAKAIDKAVFPGMQGGPHMHTISGIAVAMKEAGTESFKEYAHQVVKNAQALGEKLQEFGFKLVSGGTDNHLLLLDMRSKNISGKKMAKALDRAGIVTNCNTVPNDPAPPFNPSGVRIGTPAVTTRGMKESDMAEIAEMINDTADNLEDLQAIDRIGKRVRFFCSRFPLPKSFIHSEE
ncbi:Serine hydroxymethyltransferase [Sedimentisphaera cyanobacteriorum]|uniref:Serine hydroxymethyltransferase n=1 Tax=Sedimentisphaera cyanobacteriorum TaxID=1940790 RepID=A0A1Q2HNQ0_9BACT|nr:serine hydroxymethyltransferase [Sedimentisphaera cyanobacteriorum]AQQ09077.1 Serine hydroxymethyltransferase [Sedimentisphaera cyanobacteriorum]